MLAASHSQHWNGAEFGQSLGLDAKTVGRYVDFLEGAYLIRRLPPYHANLKKRLVKAPKVYWRDSGLAHALLGVEADRQLLEQPWVGVSFECPRDRAAHRAAMRWAVARSPTFSGRTTVTRSTSCSRSVAPAGRSNASCPSKPDRRDLEKLTRWAREARVGALPIAGGTRRAGERGEQEAGPHGLPRIARQRPSARCGVGCQPWRRGG